MNTKNSSIILFLVACIIPTITGCTVTGALIGSGIDRIAAGERQVNGHDADRVPRSRRVQIISTNGGTLYGENQGIYELIDLSPCFENSTSAEEYKDSAVKVPSFNDTIRTGMSLWRKNKYTFIGLDRTGLVIGLQRYPSVKSLPLKKAYSVSSLAGQPYDLERLASCIKSGEQTGSNTLILNSSREYQQIRIDNIARISYRQAGRKGKTVGMLIGLAADATLIAIALDSMHRNSGNFMQ
ncbi:hypothetical protein KKH18_14425 [bacterium]|nr:hypothetical protein [bacterium]